MLPLAEEMLAHLAKMPAKIDGEFERTWGTTLKLYNFQAMNSFGNKYLLGVYETAKETEKAAESGTKSMSKPVLISRSP